MSTDTDADSFTGSYRLYLGLGMHIFRREHLYEKEIRPGQELRLLTPEALEGGMATGCGSAGKPILSATSPDRFYGAMNCVH